MLTVAALALLVGELAIFRRPDLTRTGFFLFSDASYSLFVTSEVLDGARLYRDVAYPYGWLPVALYSAAAACFGNTPTVYLHFFLAISTLGLLLAFVLCRRFLPIGLSLAATTGGLLPVFLVPGALLGGYVSSYYLPVERALLVLAALLWRPPLTRSRSAGIALGAVVAALQTTRFGPGLVLAVVLVAIDGLLLRGNSPNSTRAWFRSVLPILAAAVMGELILAAAAFTLLPRPIALDVLWPAYFAQVFGSGVHRWPDVSNWRLVVAQYSNPAAGILLTLAGVWMWVRRRQSAADETWALFLLPMVFIGGVFTFFRTDHHLRQFAWVFVPGAVAALSQSRWCRAVALCGWIPVAAVVASSVVRGAHPDRTLIDLPGGWRLSATEGERQRIEGIHHALDAVEARYGRGPVLFDANGAGFYVIYAIPHVSRHIWFYRAAVRQYEIEQLERQYRALTALVVCRFEQSAGRSESILNDTFPEALAPAIAARAAEIVWSDGQCRVFRLRPVPPS